MNVNLKNYIIDAYDRYYIKKREKNEIHKYNDPRRKNIYEKITLTESQKRSIDELYMSNYGEKIPYTWHQHFTAFTGNFDVNYFPELLYIPDFEHFMNDRVSFVDVLHDKNFIPYVARVGGVKMPRIFLSGVNGLIRNENYRFISKKQTELLVGDLGECFYKPARESGSGRACQVYNFKNGKDSYSGKSVGEIINTFEPDFVLQEKLVCHDSLRAFNKSSVNTFRVITYIWREEVIAQPILMRFGIGDSIIDNAHAGGMFIAVDEDGTVHDTAFTEFNERRKSHPETGMVFGEHKIPLVATVIKAAKELHQIVPEVGTINWDFTIDFDGKPVLIEANCTAGSVWLVQMSHGVGAFGDRTSEVLRWIRKMKSLPVKIRKDFRYGQM